jgi:uncharacterized protein
MATHTKTTICDGTLLKQIVLSGLTWLDVNQEKVNQLNVFPVPDGDTGTNMFLTMRKAGDSVRAINGADEAHVGKVARAIANGALLGARGNSGVILSQWWRGFAEALENHPQFDSAIFALACQNAVERAYKAVVKPVEGTILTVTRQAMEAVVAQASDEGDLSILFDRKVQAAYDALRRTPDLLPVLKDAGVVDSGGQGWIYIVEGMLRHLRGEAVAAEAVTVSTGQPASWQEALVPEDEEGYGYDVQFLIHGENMDVDAVRADINAMGWSTLVVGDDNLIKVHVHVHDPGVPISYAIKLGKGIDDIVVENMQLQYHDYVAERAAREESKTDDALHVVDGIAVVAVTVGDSLRTMFAKDLGTAYIIAGGQTMNPSTEDFMEAIQKLPNDEIILLPNNPNILMAAQQAASLAHGKQVRVVPSRSIPQGIAAMMEYANEKDSLNLNTLTEAMTSAIKHVITGEVTTATRSVSLDGVEVKSGQFIGLIDDKLRVAGDSVMEVVIALLQKAGADARELITLYYGDTVTADEAEALIAELESQFAGLEFQAVRGGQPLYPYIISIE